jgi:hypothetical protein
MRPVISWQQKLLRNIRRCTNATFFRRGRYRGHHRDRFSSVYNKRRRIGVPRLDLHALCCQSMMGRMNIVVSSYETGRSEHATSARRR